MEGVSEFVQQVVMVVFVCIRCVVENLLEFIWVDCAVVKLLLVWSGQMETPKLFTLKPN